MSPDIALQRLKALLLELDHAATYGQYSKPGTRSYYEISRDISRCRQVLKGEL